MSETRPLQRWAFVLAAFLLLYFVLFVGFADTEARVVAQTATLIIDFGLWFACAALALSIARQSAHPTRRLMLVLGATCLVLAVADTTWNASELVRSCPLRLGLDRAQVVSEVLFNIGWILFLGALVVEAYASWRPQAAALLTIAILIPLVVGIFAATYLPALGKQSFAFECGGLTTPGGAEDVRRNLALVNVGLQSLGVGLAVAASMVPLLAGYRAIVSAYLILVAADFVMWTKFELGSVEGYHWNLVWILAIAFVLVGLQTLHLAVRAGHRIDHPVPDSRGPNRSRLSGPITFLMIIPLAATILLGVLIRDPDYLVAVSFLLLMLVLIGATAASTGFEGGFDRFVDTLVGRIEHRPPDPPKPLERMFYEVTNLEYTTRLIDGRLGGGLDRLLRVGEEIRFPLATPAPDADADPTCFIVMPFGPEWAGTVHGAIRDAAEECGYRSVRGDDFFGSNDIMDDVWVQMRRARVVVADLTGRNPNVFYEVGMAHTLGMPILLLSQSVEDIPFDLASRRVIHYDLADGTERLARAIKLALLEIERTARARDAARTDGHEAT